MRVGVWGVGTWGEKHARVYRALAGAALQGVYDTDAARARLVAERYETRAFDRPEALLEACEAVTIAVPTTAHAQAFEQAAAAGCHALVEKPMAPTVEEADAMLRAAETHGVQLQVGQVERFNPVLLAAAGELRDPKFIEGHRLALFQPRSLDIDVVFDLMIHDIDIVLDRVGLLPDRVSAVGVAVLSGNEDIANARLEFPNGCVANLTASRVSQERLRRIRFVQDDLYLSADLYEKRGELLRVDRDALHRALASGGGPGASLAALQAIDRAKLEPEDGEPLTLELDAFIGSLTGKAQGAASGTAGREALRVASQVRDAMKDRARLWQAKPSGVS